MSKTYVNTKKNQIAVIKHAIKKGPEARFKFDGNILKFTSWVAGKWNRAHPDDKITKEDVELTLERAKELKKSFFLPKEKNSPEIYCLNTYRPPYVSSILKN